MKITISQADAEAYILARFNSLNNNVFTTVTIVPTVAVLTYCDAIRQVTKEFPRYFGNQKISAIKRLRELVPGLGLYEAKVAIESPNDAIGYWVRTGKPYL